MAYDERLAERIRATLQDVPGLTERKMFGGLAFMLDGHMCCGIVGDELMLRLGPDRAEKALDQAHVRPMNFTGRPMTGMVFVEPEGFRGEALSQWIGEARAFVRSLLPKALRSRPRSSRSATSK